jgi:hypothetical protein
MLGFTQDLWRNGIWFSDNDVLHVGMILWIFHIWKLILPLVKDGNEAGEAI